MTIRTSSGRSSSGLGGTKPPFHVGIVVKRPVGSPAVLEAGPDDQTWVWVLDLAPRMRDFEGILQVRRCKVALTPEQSRRLTAFALAQDNNGVTPWHGWRCN